MLELYKIGITDLDLKDILETNPKITDISDEDIHKLINILKQINCNNQTIKNIIISNPFYLTRLDTDIINLINKLTTLGLNTLNLLFDSNPYLLNKDDFEIEDFVNDQLEKYTLEEIIDIIDNNPFIIDEI